MRSHTRAWVPLRSSAVIQSLGLVTAGYTLPHLLYTNLSLQLIFTTISVPKMLIKTIYDFIPTLYWWHEVSYVLELVYIVIAVLVVDSSRGSIAVYAMMSLWFTACWIYVYTRILYPSIYDLSLQLNLRLNLSQNLE